MIGTLKTTYFRKYPFGVTYQHWPDPSITKEEWSTDLRRIAEYKLNHVWLTAHWAKIESRAGEYDFTGIDEKVALAKENELKVHLVLEGYRGGEEGPPPTWFLSEYKEAYVEGDGWSSDSMMPRKICQNNPAVKEKVGKFFEAIAEHYRDEEAILLYNIHWEPSFVCQCKHTIKEYVEWLKAKYGSIERLRAVWSAPNILDWSDVIEFKPGIGLGFPYITPTLDWRSFCLFNLAGIIKAGTQAIKGKDPNHPVLSHPILSMIPLGYSISSGVDDWLIARNVDILGTSFYPTIYTNRGPLDPSREGWLWAETLDALRCAACGKPLFIAELQTHYQSRYHPLDRISPGQMSVLCWMCVSHGAKGITMWKWRPFLRGPQLSGRGLTLHDGTPTLRAEAVKKVGEVLEKHSEVFLNMEPVAAEVAILFNPMVYLRSMYSKPDAPYVEHCITSLGGYYRALWESHVPVDFLRPEEIAGGRLSQYRLLYMPFITSLDKNVARNIVDFVEKGGFLVADSPCAVTDDFEIDCYKVMPGAGLDDLFKCRERDLYAGQDARPSSPIYSERPTTTPGISIRITSSHPALPHLELGTKVSGSLYAEELEVLPGGKVLGTFDNGSPAIISALHGKGGSVFIGSCLGRSYFRYHEENVSRLLSGFAKWAGVTRQVELIENSNGEPIDITLHDYDDGKVLFALNLGEKTSSIKLRLRIDEVANSCFSLTEGESISISHEGRDSIINAIIPPLGVRVYKIM